MAIHAPRSRAGLTRQPTPLPGWAAWQGRAPAFTLGVEEEAVILDADTLQPARRSAALIAGLVEDLRLRVSPETHACVVECKTGVHRDVGTAVEELALMRARLGESLAQMGMRAACSGTHPFATGEAGAVSEFPRYRRVAESMRLLARREPTMALHVHVGIPDPDDAVRVLRRLREATPLLLALSVNSPFLHGEDSGFCSVRTAIFGGFPRTGPPRAFGSYAEYVAAVDPLLDSGALPDPTFLWWDVRLQPWLGTVEVRLMDVQMTPADTAPLVALVQSLARLALEEEPGPVATVPELLEENRFLAARDGAAAQLITGPPYRRRPVTALLPALLEECRPHAEALGCAGALEAVTGLLEDTGASRQREWARFGQLALVQALAARFSG